MQGYTPKDLASIDQSMASIDSSIDVMVESMRLMINNGIDEMEAMDIIIENIFNTRSVGKTEIALMFSRAIYKLSQQ